jgi:hypothetical protein
MIRTKLLIFSLGMSGMAVLAGCGLGGLTPPQTPLTSIPQPTSVLFLSVPTKIAIKASATIDAAATYPFGTAADLENMEVGYSVSCASAGACGTLGPSDEGGAAVYTAPPAIPAGGTVTITATSVANPALSNSATVTVTPPIPISVSFATPAPASMEVNSSASLEAQILNDISANPQVQWTVTCGGSACGAFNPPTTNNWAKAVFAAPSVIPSGSTVTVTATSVADPTKSASATIVITPQTSTLADGTYVFQISAQPGSNASFITGVFVAKGGTITGGEQDTVNYQEYGDSDGNYSSVGYSSFAPITGGSYSVAADGNLQIFFQQGENAVANLTGSLASGGHGLIAAIDGVPAGGTVDLQTSTAAPAGGYAISLYGGDGYQSPMWIGGILNVDSQGQISGNGSLLDVVDGSAGYGGTPTGKQPIAASTVSAPDALGRITIQLNPGASSTLQPVTLAAYVVDAQHLRLVLTGEESGYTYGSFNGVLGGSALSQGAATGKFTAASFAGSSFVFGASGWDTHGLLQVAGVLTPSSDGSLTGTLNWNDLNTKPQEPLPLTGTWTIDPTGRVALSNLTDGSTFNYNLHLYLTGDGGGLLLSNDTDDVFSGQVFQQQSSPFTAASLIGMYGLNATLAPIGAASAPATGTVTASPDGDADAFAGYADTGDGAEDFAVSGRFAPASNGVFQGTITGLNPAARSTASSFTLYLIDGTQGVAIETDSTQLTLAHLQLAQ